MASVYAEVRAALENRLNDTVGLPAIAWENVDYKPATDTPFIKFQFLPVQRRATILGQNPQAYYSGISRFLLHYPENSGPGASQDVVDTLVDRFDCYTDITQDSTTITIEYAQQESPYSDSPWFVTPVTVGWFLYN